MTIEEAFIDEFEKIAGLKKIPLHFAGGLKQGFKPGKATLKDVIEAVGSKSFKAGFPVGKALRKIVGLFGK